MKRKIVCDCGNSATVLLQGASAVTQSRKGECLDCGDERRAKEADKRSIRIIDSKPPQ